MVSDFAKARGEDPEPLLRKATVLLEPMAKQYPDSVVVANMQMAINEQLGINLQLRGESAATGLLKQTLESAMKMGAMEKRTMQPLQLAMETLYYLIDTTQSEPELANLLSQADLAFSQCKAISPKAPPCFVYHFMVYVQAAVRSHRLGLDPQKQLEKAHKTLEEVRQRGGSFVELERNDALMRYIEASRKVREKQDPSGELAEMGEALKKCLAIEEKEMMCRTLGIKKAWIESQWQEVSQNKAAVVATVLEGALQRAREVVKSPEVYPDAWQAMAETELMLARKQKKAGQREAHVEGGLEAAGKALAINPRMEQGLVTQGELYLLRAQDAPSPEARRAAAAAAVQALDSLAKNHPALTPAYQPLLAQARALSSAQ
jgi:hypothetical protein